ncbi:carbonic anhydrase family protein [Sediminitomix flava]|uniref:Carbonic anhydrase n=1 Tax=Sediminitomix flava TaxID=379075 RepID=A0A315ZCV1_SEDFL|nr:carbonic anhydrase family protein [Sediminitomix flava]PWJ43381.1 carbonic anhydrase [Sediminitomix flava]
MKSIILFLLCSFFIACKHSPKDETVADNHLKQTHYLSVEKGHGKLQSPINIVTSEEDDSTHTIYYNYTHITDKPHQLINEGKTVKVEYEPGSTFSFDGIEYNFDQLHFHTPSEHLIDGVTYPMEMHLVHSNTNKDGSKNYLVLAVLFKEGTDPNFFKELIERIPDKVGDRVVLPAKSLDVRSLAKGLDKSKDFAFFHYRGSLTTPPHTERVEWIIFKHIFEASPHTIQRINKIEGDNARHIQEVFNREID